MISVWTKSVGTVLEYTIDITIVITNIEYTCVAGCCVYK